MGDEVMTSVETAETTDSFMDGWDDVDAEETADQQEEAAEEGSEESPAAEENTVEETPATEETTPAQQAQAPKTWTLRHMGEDKTVDEAEMTVLAQKGMDYDRIRAKYDESKPMMELIGHLAKEAGMDVSAFVADLRSKVKQSSGMSEAEARRAVELEDREAAVAAKEAAESQRQSDADLESQAQAQEDARRRADVERFRTVFPDAAKDPKAIPQEVWTDVRSGLTLVEAYSKYAVAKAQQAQQTAERTSRASAQNRKNASRSTGSMRSAGESSKGRDSFMEGWDS